MIKNNSEKIGEISREKRKHKIRKRSGAEKNTVGLSWEVKTEELKVVGLNPGESDKVESASPCHRGTLSGQCLNHSYERMVQGYCEAIMSSCRQWLRKSEQTPPIAEADIL